MDKKLWQIGAFVLLGSLCVVSTGQGAFQDGLVSYWEFDGTLADTNLLNNGTMMGTNATPTYDTGKFGQGIDLDGVDQFVEIANESAFDFVGQDFSISAWFRVDAFDKDWQALIAKGEGNRWRVHRRGGDVPEALTWNGGNADVPAYDAAAMPINDGQLHHFLGVSDFTNGEVRQYLDGVLVATGPAPTVENNDMPVMIGENPDARGRTWNGLIDDVAVWGRALDNAEIANIWNNGNGASIRSLLDNPPVQGDVNGDGVVNIADFEPIRQNFLQSVTTRAEGDLNLDGTVNFDDFRLWKSNAGAVAATASVPEPGTMVLIAVGLLGALRLRRR
ncbi:MAG: LamG-like jellyroll fold domain-containing protein [Pirellulaceae bacterium]|nr:PEP-CTERM sorting domain-containing protein [Planctomycetales bacterium]